MISRIIVLILLKSYTQESAEKMAIVSITIIPKELVFYDINLQCIKNHNYWNFNILNQIYMAVVIQCCIYNKVDSKELFTLLVTLFIYVVEIY